MSDAAVRTTDHVVALTPDLDASAAIFEKLGFRVTLRAAHSEALGTENRCVMLKQGYIELLTVCRPSPANAQLRERLAQGGWAGIALGSDDIAKTRALLEGYATAGSPLTFNRPVPGFEEQARFTILQVSGVGLTGLEIFFCQHHTPHLLRNPNDTSHPNGASSLGSCRVRAADIAAARAFFTRIGALASEEIELADVEAHPRASIDCVSVAVRDLASVRQCIRAAGLVSTESACGIELPVQFTLPFPLQLISES